MRPISLLVVISKLFERTLLPRLLRHVGHRLSFTQFAFQKGLSPLDAFALLKRRIKESLSRPSRGRPFLFLDILKAYDSVWWHGLLYKMIQLGVPILYIKLIKIWLENRFVYAKSGSKVSSWKQIFKGLPQGGVLCCILWAIYINDLPECLAKYCQCLLFADDVQLTPILGGTDSITQITTAAAIACIWANKWILVLSNLKSMYICVNIAIPPSTLKLYEVSLIETTNYKHLGIHFSNDGKWLNV